MVAVPLLIIAQAPAQSVNWRPGDFIALGALLVALVTLFLTGRQRDADRRHDRQLREEDRRDQRRREAALALGPVYGLLVDANPRSLAFNAHKPDFPERHRAVRARWESQVSPALMAIAAGSPSPEERSLAHNLAVTVHSLLVLGSSIVRYRQEGRDAASLAEAVQEFDRADQLLDQLAAEIRGEGPPGG